jgi:hypothetical protein
MKILHSLALIAFLSSCSFDPFAPTGYYQWNQVDGHFEPEKNNDEIQALLRRSSLQCSNEMMQIKIPSRVVTPDGDGSLSSVYEKASSDFDSAYAQKDARKDREKYFNNCMELNGFVSKWIEYEVVSD